MKSPVSLQVRERIAEMAQELPPGDIHLKMGMTRGGDTEGTEERGTLYLPLDPAGYPISPDDLDFGGGNPTAAQIKNASRFSQLMNQIPNPGQKFWTASGDVVWNIWDTVLRSMQLPVGGSTNILQQLKANLEMERRSDMQGDIYYPTNYSPDGFWEATSNNQWKSIAFSPKSTSRCEVMSACTATRGVHDLEFDATGMHFKAEVILVTLLRPWWSPWLFSSTAWRLPPASLTPPLSDGMNPPKGVMTMYANAFLVARNVHLGLDMSRPKNSVLTTQIQRAHALTWSAFQMKGASRSSSPVDGVAELKLTSDGLHSNGLQILGFSCNVLPKCPNPDQKQQWP